MTQNLISCVPHVRAKLFSEKTRAWGCVKTGMERHYGPPSPQGSLYFLFNIPPPKGSLTLNQQRHSDVHTKRRDHSNMLKMGGLFLVPFNTNQQHGS